jgi:hypothetical protein
MTKTPKRCRYVTNQLDLETLGFRPTCAQKSPLTLMTVWLEGFRWYCIDLQVVDLVDSFVECTYSNPGLVDQSTSL